MAIVNKQTRKSNPFKHKERAQVNKNTFDLSHDVKTTFEMGWLTPFMCIETLPGDSFRLSSEVMMRFAPLILPIMHRVELHVRYFYVPNRILWPKPNGWEDFIVGKDNVEWAYCIHEDVTTPNSVATYLGFNNNFQIGANLRVSVLPIAAYYKIYDEYFRNPLLQQETFVPVIEGSNAGEPRYNQAFIPRHENWGLDYFTSAKPTPQLGQDVLVPMIGSAEDAGPWQWLEANGTQYPTSGDTNMQLAGGDTHLRALTGTPAHLDIQSTAASIAELRLAIKLQEWLEKLNRTTQRYRDFLEGFFNSDPSPLQIDDPVWIGSSRSTITISEVMQVSPAETTQGETPLGAYAGQALAFNGGKSLNYRCSEHGWIIGLISVIPRTSYFQGIQRKFTRESYLDYAYPQFAGIGDQAIRIKELAGDAPTSELNDTWGYIPRYSEYRYENDIVSGQMRTTFLDFHLAREFDTSATSNFALNTVFLQCMPRRTDIFVLPTEEDHECYAHIFNKVTVSRNLPRYGIPQL